MSDQLFKKRIIVRGLEISPPIILAPMVGLSHSAFRSLVQAEGGVGLLFTEMLAAKRLPHDNEFCSPLLIRDETERPLIYQIIAADENTIDAAVHKLHKLKADGIDLNLGCPAPVKGGRERERCWQEIMSSYVKFSAGSEKVLIYL